MQRELHPVRDRHLKRFDIWEQSKEGPCRRVSEVRKSYDCSLPSARHLCMHSRGAEHGFRFEEWWYGLSRENFILSMGVCCPEDSSEVPPIYRRLIGSPPVALHTSISRCVPFLEKVVSRKDPEFVQIYVQSSYEQREEFWQALEAMLADEIIKYRSTRAN